MTARTGARLKVMRVFPFYGKPSLLSGWKLAVTPPVRPCQASPPGEFHQKIRFDFALKARGFSRSHKLLEIRCPFRG